MGAGLSAVSLFQAHSHSLALISNCFFIFVCTFKDRNQGESEREKAKVGVKGESRWLLPHPLCVPRPPCWQTTHNVCLQSPLWSQHTATGRKGECGGKAWRCLASGESQGRKRTVGHQPLGCPGVATSWVKKQWVYDVQLACVLMLSALWVVNPLPPGLQKAIRVEGICCSFGTVGSQGALQVPRGRQ